MRWDHVRKLRFGNLAGVITGHHFDIVSMRMAWNMNFSAHDSICPAQLRTKAAWSRHTRPLLAPSLSSDVLLSGNRNAHEVLPQ